MGDQHGMTDFSDATRQGDFGEDSNGDVANFGNGALNTLDHQSLVSSPTSMATGAFKHRDVFKQGFGDLRGDLSGVGGDLRRMDWGAINGKFSNIRTEMGAADGKYADFMQKGRGVVGLDPLKWLVGTLVDFLIQTFQPLEDLLGLVTGNEARMNVSANMWQDVAAAMPPIAEYMNSATTEELAEWVGEAGEAARARIMELGLMVEGVGYLAMGMDQVLKMMAGLARVTRQFVQKLITDGVVWVIKTIAPQIAASIATFGAAAPVCIAMTVAKIAGLVLDAIQFINGAVQFFQTLGQLLGYFQELFGVFKPFLEDLVNVPSIKVV